MSVEGAGRLLFGLGMAVVVSATLAYARQSRRKAIAAMFFVGGAMLHPMLARPGGVVFAETWASVLIGLSVDAYVARLWLPGALLGVLAVFIRELAGAYALVCGLLALRARRWREFSRLGCRRARLRRLLRAARSAGNRSCATRGSNPRALVIPGARDPALFLCPMYVYGWLAAAPAILTPIAAAFGLAAIWARSAPAQLTFSLIAYVGLFCVAAQPFDFYWGYLTCAIWGHALRPWRRWTDTTDRHGHKALSASSELRECLSSHQSTLSHGILASNAIHRCS